VFDRVVDRDLIVGAVPPTVRRLLGAADRVIGLMNRFAACFHDERRPELVEHEVPTLVGQRYLGSRGYEDLNDHDELRHDPIMAVLAANRQPDGRTVPR
jgi:hypothetical protein